MKRAEQGGHSKRKLYLVGLALGLSLGGLCGCASSTPAEAPQPEPESSPNPEPLVEPAPEPPVQDDAGAGSTEAPAPAGPSPQEVVGEICESTCTKVEANCAPRVAAFCRASCGDYVGASEKCPVEVKEALSCQQEADDFLLCSNIAAESCAPLYRRMTQCREGEVTPKPWGAVEVAAPSDGLPPGFEKKSVAAHGFTQVMPSSAQVSMAEGQNFEAKGKDTAGTMYLVKSLELGSTKKPTDASILRTATKFVGNACQPKLRLHGRFETQGVIHVRFDTVCESGTAYHGIIHFWDGKSVVATTVRESEAPDPNPNLEAFLFGFEKN